MAEVIKRSAITGETDKEREKCIQRYFREVFTNGNGRAVLNIILTDLRYFDVCKDEEDMYLNNFAKHLLSNRLGLRDTVAITDCLFTGQSE